MPTIDHPHRDETPKSLFNPLKFDFVTDYRNDNNELNLVTIPSMEIKTFPKYMADIIEKHLVDAIKNDRETDLFSKEEDDKIREEINIHES